MYYLAMYLFILSVIIVLSLAVTWLSDREWTDRTRLYIIATVLIVPIIWVWFYYLTH
jgi:hypothetical protein